MPTEHEHEPSVPNHGHRRPCAHQVGLLDHHDRVQREASHRWRAGASASAARRYPSWALGSSGVGILLTLLALLTG